ncbi:alpha-1,6-glucosidase domain-containing protein [Massilia sp. S19_KUP03_FR1]|uniref:alpha-1,6-glucosidase domain-containing protein n=1 Tax=Massilia sp. S19_KUP03_FR1 TaxID=3025503 RepID=UPI002FCD7BBB
MFPSRFAALAAALLPLAAHAAIPLSSCDDPGFQQVLHANASTLPAQAVWIDRATLRWPAASSAGTFKLYYSADATLDVKVGAKVSGASLALTKTAAGLRVADAARLPDLHRGQLVLVQEAADGTVIAATRIQLAAALDDIYARAAAVKQLGVTVSKQQTAFKLWAPTARQAAVCTYASGTSKASAVRDMDFDRATGVWRAALPGDQSGHYYRYAVDVVVNGVGLVRNLVTDPYSVSLNTNSKRSYIADLSAPTLKPAGWDKSTAPATVRAQTDMTVYELHVRDFSINDPTVSAPHRGKYAAFGEAGSNGMRHLSALARAGLTDIHLLPVYDIGSVPERGCAVPQPGGAADSDAQQALVAKTAETDCFNWGYDPYHYNAPEGSYATDPEDGARRIVEFREMVQNLHKAGLRVGMDVVYNHTYQAGQQQKSVLDRIVPGYYHRLDAQGAIEQSTCCDNTATEHRMMGKLMTESVALWATQYHIDSFRFDLMGHQPKDVMVHLQRQVNQAAGRTVELIGEGWNFGEVADGKRFVQASQLSLNGTGIGTFSDRARDAIRGGGSSDSGEKLISGQGYINGLVYDPNALAGKRPAQDLLRAADMVRVGLAGSLRSYPMLTWQDRTVRLEKIDYSGQPAGYASQPGEAVNYIENHDNQTLFDIDIFKLPLATSTHERARVQVLGMAINAFSQGVAYFHAGVDTLRSKSLDRNSFNSGDWFNRLDWSYQDNYFGTGLPPAQDNGKDYALLQPLLANPSLKPAPSDIAYARDAFRALLQIRASSTLFRMRSAADVQQRLRFFNTGSTQEPTVLAAHLDGRGYPGARFQGITYLINVDKVAHTVLDAGARGKNLRPHPVQVPGTSGATYDAATGAFTVPARSVVVYVED